MIILFIICFNSCVFVFPFYTLYCILTINRFNVFNVYKHFRSTIRGITVAHGDTTDLSPVLPIAFRRDMRPYTPIGLQSRPADIDPCSASETL